MGQVSVYTRRGEPVASNRNLLVGMGLVPDLDQLIARLADGFPVPDGAQKLAGRVDVVGEVAVGPQPDLDRTGQVDGGRIDADPFDFDAGAGAAEVVDGVAQLINIVILILVNMDIARAFGKSAFLWGFVLLTLLSAVGYILLGFGDARYQKPATA